MQKYFLSTNYIDGHKEGTFTWNGSEYYVNELYNQPLKIVDSTMFFPTMTDKGLQNIIFSSGTTQPVYSSAIKDGKIIVLFDIPGITGPPDYIQYFAFLDPAKLQPTTLKTGKTKAQTDTSETQLNKDIQTTVEVGNLSFLEQLLNSILPGNSYLWVKKNGKWILLTGAALIAYKLSKSKK